MLLRRYLPALIAALLCTLPNLAAAKSAGTICVLIQPAKLFLAEDGRKASGRLDVGRSVTLKHQHKNRWMVQADNGKLGFLNTRYMEQACEYQKPTTKGLLTAPSNRDAPNLNLGDLVETHAALEVTKLAALGQAPVSKDFIRQQVALVDRVRSEKAKAASSNACKADKDNYRVAVYDFELNNIPDGIGRVVSNSLLSEIRKLEGISAIGMDEIREMVDFESQRQAMGCDSNDACMAEIAGALGVDEIITGQLSEEANGRSLVLRRIDQRRAEIVHSDNQRLTIGDGEEFLLAIGSAVETIYPERPNRPGTTRGVPDKVLLRLNPPPISATATLTSLGVSLATLVVGGIYTYQAQQEANFYNSGGGLSPGYYDGDQRQAINQAQANAQNYTTIGNASLIAGGVLALGSTVMSLFTDWELLGSDSDDN